MDLSERLRTAREHAGHANASEFARLLGVAPNSVYRYERGEQQPSLDVVSRWAELTATTLDWLGRGVGDPPAAPAGPLKATGTGDC